MTRTMSKALISVLLLAGCAVGQTDRLGLRKCKNSTDYNCIGAETDLTATIDVPAATVRSPLNGRDWSMCGGALITEHGVEYCAIEHGCTDLDRILIGPDGHGKYWCHLPQIGGKP